MARLDRRCATNVAASVYLIPPLTTLIAWLFLGETVTVWFAVGTAAIIGGVALVERSRQQDPTRQAPPDAARPAPAPPRGSDGSVVG